MSSSVSLLFTPLPWCFSPFPRGTSSLSVSHVYLAFDGLLHRFTLHSHPELLPCAAHEIGYGARTLSGPFSSRFSSPQVAADIPPPTQRGLHSGLLPFRSPLLRESSLISFPPVTDMLKFAGCSPSRQDGFRARRAPCVWRPFRVLPRPSSSWEPRDPPSKLLCCMYLLLYIA